MAASCAQCTQIIIAFDIGLWLAAQSKGLRCVDVRPAGRLSVDQPVQKIQDMVFCGDTLGQGHFYGDQHSLFIVMQNQRQDIDHFPITARLAQHEILLLFECRGGFRERRAVSERPWLTLKNCQIVPPVVNRARWELVATLDHPHMLTQDLTLDGVTPEACFQRDHQTARVDPAG